MHLTHYLVGLLACATFGRAHDGNSEQSDLAEDDDDTTWFERVDVPLTFDRGGRYVAGISMSQGPSRQNFSFTFSTGTGSTFVAGAGGNLSPAGTNLYDQGASATAQLVAQSADTSIFGEPSNTTVVKEACALFSTGSELWEYDNQTIFVIKSLQEQNSLQRAARMQLGSEISGIAGLGTNRKQNAPSTDSSIYQASFEDSIIGQWLREYHNAASFTFGLALEPPAILPQMINASLDDTDSVGAVIEGTAGTGAGTLHLMQPDKSFFETDSIKWVNANVNVSMRSSKSSLPSSDWTVILDGWTFSTQSNRLSSNGQILVDIDPMYTSIYIPQNQAILLYTAIPGANLRTDLSTLGNFSQSWTVPCNAQFTFAVIINGQSFVLDQTQLVVKQKDGSCVSSIEGWTNPFEPQYIFGSRFMSNVYLIFNVPRDGVPTIGIANRTDPNGNSSSLDIKSIVGGTIGGAALLALIIMGIIYFRRKSNEQRHAAESGDKSGPSHAPDAKTWPPQWQVEPFTMPSPTSMLEYQNRHGAQPSSPPLYHMVSAPSSPGQRHDKFSTSVAPPTHIGSD